MGIRRLIERRTTGKGLIEVATVDASAGSASAGKVVSLGAAGILDPTLLPAASTSAPGSMSAADKTKLDGLGGGGSVTASTVAVTATGNISSTNAQAAFVEHQGDIDSINTTLSAATATSAGAGDSGKLTKLDGAGKLGPSALPAATTSAAGSMSASDKTKLDAVTGTNTGDQTATTVPVTPTGNISSTTVQAGLVEHQGDIDGINTTLNAATATSAGAGDAAKLTKLNGSGLLGPSVLPAATTSAAGSMSAADKTKLDAVTGTNTGDQTVAGSTGYIQYKGSGNTLDATSGLAYTAGSTLLTVPNLAMTGTGTITANSPPSAPAAGTLAVWAQTVGSRVVPMFKGPSSADTIIQASLARGKVCFWLPSGAASSANPTGTRFSSVTIVGTATGRGCAATNVLTRQLRLGIVSAASAGSITSARTSGNQVTVGTGTAGVGGFWQVFRFGCSDVATVAGARQFVGVSTSVGAPSDGEPSALTNCIGVGHGTADTNLKIFYGGSSAQTPIDLGANFPANTLSADMYELILFAPSTSSTGDVSYQVTRVNTGHLATGTISNTGATVLPASSSFINYMMAWRSNNATALAVALDLVSVYVEMDV